MWAGLMSRSRGAARCATRSSYTMNRFSASRAPMSSIMIASCPGWVRLGMSPLFFFLPCTAMSSLTIGPCPGSVRVVMFACMWARVHVE